MEDVFFFEIWTASAVWREELNNRIFEHEKTFMASVRMISCSGMFRMRDISPSLPIHLDTGRSTSPSTCGAL